MVHFCEEREDCLVHVHSLSKASRSPWLTYLFSSTAVRDLSKPSQSVLVHLLSQ